MKWIVLTPSECGRVLKNIKQILFRSALATVRRKVKIKTLSKNTLSNRERAPLNLSCRLFETVLVPEVPILTAFKWGSLRNTARAVIFRLLTEFPHCFLHTDWVHNMTEFNRVGSYNCVSYNDIRTLELPYYTGQYTTATSQVSLGIWLHPWKHS